jgi:hypothetical protein
MSTVNGKSLESWIWDSACSIRGAKDAPKFKDCILPLKPAIPDEPVWTVRRKRGRAFEAVGLEVSGQVTGEARGEVGPGQTQGQSHWSN